MSGETDGLEAVTGKVLDYEMKKNPNEQAPYTFGSSPAAIRLKKEIEKSGKSHKSVICILNLAEGRANALFDSDLEGKHYWLLLLRREAVARIEGTNADALIKSLCSNVFKTKIKVLMKAVKLGEAIALHEEQWWCQCGNSMPAGCVYCPDCQP